MNKKLFKYEVIGFVFVSILGTISHFIFDFSNANEYVGLFCPVNESPWEHLKLLFFPYILYSIIEYNSFIKSSKIFWSAKLIGVVLGMTGILSFFYLYSGIVGKTITFFDIFSFFLGVFISFLTSYLIINTKKVGSSVLNVISICIIILIGLIFFLFTYEPPYLPLFKDPITNIYGI